jgi:DNA-binding transcriptional LysR family regulator
MELRTLRAFVEVVRQGGFSPAAKTIGATQSTVSKAVKHLEDELGVPLIDRRSNRPTVPGDVVYRRALRMLAERDDLIAELDDVAGLKRGVLRLGIPLLIGSTLYAPAFTLYRRRYPGIDIRVTEYGGGQQGRQIILEGKTDLAAALLPVPADFEWQEIAADPLMALLPARHPLARKKAVDLASLRDFPFILFEPSFALYRVILDACQRHGFQPTIVAQSNQADFMAELVASGLGVAFLPRRIAALLRHPGLRPVLLDEAETHWRAAMIWRRGGYLSPAAKAWLDIMQEVHGSRRRR